MAAQAAPHAQLQADALQFRFEVFVKANPIHGDYTVDAVQPKPISVQPIGCVGSDEILQAHFRLSLFSIVEVVIRYHPVERISFEAEIEIVAPYVLSDSILDKPGGNVIVVPTSPLALAQESLYVLSTVCREWRPVALWTATAELATCDLIHRSYGRYDVLAPAETRQGYLDACSGSLCGLYEDVLVFARDDHNRQLGAKRAVGGTYRTTTGTVREQNALRVVESQG